MGRTPYSAKEVARRFAEPFKRAKYTVYVQGKLLIVKALSPHADKIKPGTKGKIKGFSMASRFNLLKLIARIDWSKVVDGVFVTLTYPDDQCNVETREASMHRNRWIRYAEKYLQQRVAVLWRKEQEARKSGQFEKWIVPHFHLAMFGVKWLPKEAVQAWWRKTIGAGQGPLCTRIDDMNSGEHAAFYLCKYLTKGETTGLDYPSYLNSPGRAWGVRRKELLPIHKAQYIDTLNHEQYERVLEICRHTTAFPLAWAQDSFTLLGKDAETAAADILELLT